MGQRKEKNISGYIGLLALSLALTSPWRANANEQMNGYSAPHFSPNGRFVSLNYCDVYNISSTCNGIYFDRTSGKFFSFSDSAKRRIIDIAFSPNGTRAAFVFYENTADESPAGRVACIAVMDIATFRYRRGSCGSGERRYVSFIDEDRIVYFVADTPKKNGRRLGKMLFAADVQTMEEKAIISEKFYGPSSPQVLQGRELVAFSDFGYVASQKLKKEKSFPDERLQDDLLNVSIREKSITVVDAGNTNLIGPRIATSSGDIYTLQRESSTAEKGYIHDIYVLRSGRLGLVARVEKYVWGMDVSPNGQWIAAVVATANRKIVNGQFMLYETQSQTTHYFAPTQLARIVIAEE